MSRLYHVTGSVSLNVIIDTLKQRPSSTLYIHQMEHSLWKEALTDGTNYVWIEGDTLIAWGSNDPTAIFRELKERFAARCTLVG